MDDSNWKLIGERSTTVFIDCRFSTIWKRISQDRSRPLVTARTFAELEALFKQRRPRYLEAAHRVDGERPPDVIAEEVLKLWSD